MIRVLLGTTLMAMSLISCVWPSSAIERRDIFLSKSKDYRGCIPMKTVQKIPLPKGYHEGLTLLGERIWVNNGEGHNTWVFDKKTGEQLSEISPAGFFTEAATYYKDDKYWVSDWADKKLYLVKIEEGKMVAEKAVSVAPANPAGILFNGEFLYVILWHRGLGTKTALVKMDTDGNMIDEVDIKMIREPSQIAWNGEHLWISSWFDRKVYKIDPEQYTVKGYFRTYIEKTTGIVFDGDACWVTGTRAHLYRMEPVQGRSY